MQATIENTRRFRIGRGLVLSRNLLRCVRFGAGALLVFALPLLMPVSARAAESAGSVEPDTRLARALQDAGISFTTNRLGNLGVTFEFADGRSQEVFVRSQTQSWAGLEIREVLSFACRGIGLIRPEMAERLLKENAGKKLGAWELWTGSTGYDVVFVARIPATVDAAALGVILRGVAVEADAMEKEFSENNGL